MRVRARWEDEFHVAALVGEVHTPRNGCAESRDDGAREEQEGRRSRP
jgi:hypothetical protein